MAEPNSSSLSVDELLAEYRTAQKKRRTARYLMTLLIATIVFIFILLGVNAVQQFQQEEAEAFGIALTAEASEISPMVMEELGQAVNRAAPKIQDAFVKTLSENEELYVMTLSDNYIALQSYAQARWPMIEDAIAELVINQEDTARAALLQYISEDKLTELSLSYEKALNAYLESFFADNFAGDMVTAEEMVNKLQELALSEPDMPPANSQFVIGMFLELLGLEMQVNAQP